MRCTYSGFLCLLGLALAGSGPPPKLQSAELATLSAKTWREFAPRGKEVDAIYGDYVLRNDLITMVIAQPLAGRNANMTVRGVAGCVIDLTARRAGNDQLSCFYPTASDFAFVRANAAVVMVDGQERPLRPTDEASGREIVVQMTSAPRQDGVRAICRYRLADGDRFVTVWTEYTNTGDKPARVTLSDAFRADRTFTIGQDQSSRAFWCYDEWFRQSYCVTCGDRTPKRSGQQRSIIVEYLDASEASEVELQAGESQVLERRLYVHANVLQSRAQANRQVETRQRPVRLKIEDPAGPVRLARLTVTATGSETPYGVARGAQFAFSLPEGDYDLRIEALGRPPVDLKTPATGKLDQTVMLDACGHVVATVTDDQAQPIPCKIAMYGVDGTADPDFGPDSREVSCRNVYYAHDGRMRQELGPGSYELIFSYGPEYDAEFQRVEITAGQDSPVNVILQRTVDTSGWVSSDFHSHSSPSGDNTSSQYGRVLNLLCEHIEFAPCTEHNRIDSYARHLKRINAEHLMASCPGIELTGGPLPVNHQNAFPLKWKPRTQDGGAPLTDIDPVRQIERLAMWDDNSDKLVQTNHPNLMQIYGDRNTDGAPDGGFRKMFDWMDVMEVHPPNTIFDGPPASKKGSDNGNTIFHWMQLLNQGYRIPGVVNTDAHYNFHGSGWIRNYVRCSTDNPAEIAVKEMVDNASQGRLIMTTGPFLETTCSANGATVDPGQDLAAPQKQVTCHIRVQCANWLDINRVQLFLNGRPSDKHHWTRREQPEAFGGGVVKFDQQVQVDLKEDTHLIVAVINEGQQLGRVMGPDYGRQPPVAVSNPVFIDVDGQGFQANGDELDYPLPKEQGDRAE